MADSTDVILARPNVSIDPRVQSELGISLRVNLDGTFSEARRLNLGVAAIGITEIEFLPDKVVKKFDDSEDEFLTNGDATENKIRIFMGSIASQAEKQFKHPDNIADLQQIISLMTSMILLHELKHVSDNFNMGREKLIKEDQRYERRRLTKAALPGAAALGGVALMASVVAASSFLMNTLPWWAKVLGGGGVLFQAKGIVRDIFVARRKARNHTYQTGEKVYANHPAEKRAFKDQDEYRARFRRGESPLLVAAHTKNRP